MAHNNSNNQQKYENAVKEMADYLVNLREEFGQVDQSLTITNKLLQQEIDRVIKGGDGTKRIEIHRGNPMKVSTKLLIPNKEFPKVNFVGKLIGPGGSNMKRLQAELGIRMAVYGRGSMRDKSKEEELRKEGGKKYGHLNDDLHVYLEVNAPADQAYEQMGRAIATIKPYFDPNYDDGSMAMGGEMDPYSNGAGRGRGGGPRGRGGPLLPSRGRPAMPAPRGAPRGRGAPPPRSSSYEPRAYAEEDYYGGAAAAAPAVPAARNASSYGGYDAEPVYDESYRAPARDSYGAAASRQQASEVQSFDYGHGSSGDAYDSQTQDTWERRDPYQQPAARASRGGQPSSSAHRSHPYERTASRQQTRY